MKREETDVDRPVENPALLAAIERLDQDATEEAQKAVWAELRRAVFLVPTLAEGMELEPESEGKATLPEGTLIHFLAGEQDGKSYLMVFTDLKSIRDYTDLAVKAMILPAEEAWDFALGAGSYDGLVINPGGKALPLERHQLEAMVRQSVENPELVQALDRLAAEASPAAREEVLARLQQATLLVAAFPAESDEEGAIQLMLAEMDGAQYLPMFTDEDTLAETTDAEVLLQAMPAREAWAFALEKAGYCEAVVINPASHGFVIGKEQLQRFLAPQA